MSRGVGNSRQVIRGVIGGGTQMQRGGWKVERMPRSEQECRSEQKWMGEQKQPGNLRGGGSCQVSRQVSGHIRWTQRGERKIDWTWRSRQE